MPTQAQVEWIKNLPSGEGWGFDIPKYINSSHIGGFQIDNPMYNADAGNNQYSDIFGILPEYAGMYDGWGRRSLNGWGQDENYDIITSLPENYAWTGRELDNAAFGLMVKTGDKAGTVVPYRLEGDRYVPDLGNAFGREMNTTGGDTMRGLASVALAAVGGGMLGPTAATAAQAANAANAAYNAYGAYQAGDTTGALTNAAGAVAGASGAGAFGDYSQTVGQVARGVQGTGSAYQAYRNEDALGALSGLAGAASGFGQAGGLMDQGMVGALQQFRQLAGLGRQLGLSGGRPQQRPPQRPPQRGPAQPRQALPQPARRPPPGALGTMRQGSRPPPQGYRPPPRPQQGYRPPPRPNPLSTGG